MEIAVIGAGYVGLSLSVLLSQNNNVQLVDIVKEKVVLINGKKSPIIDKEISNYLKTKKLNLRATLNLEEAVKNANFVIIATPTNYDEKINYFDTSSVDDSVSRVVKINSCALIIIKSTIPVGYTASLREKYKSENIIFSPEFLREGKALYDNLFPSRIIIGGISSKAESFAKLLIESSLK